MPSKKKGITFSLSEFRSLVVKDDKTQFPTYSSAMYEDGTDSNRGYYRRDRDSNNYSNDKPFRNNYGQFRNDMSSNRYDNKYSFEQKKKNSKYTFTSDDSNSFSLTSNKDVDDSSLDGGSWRKTVTPQKTNTRENSFTSNNYGSSRLSDTESSWRNTSMDRNNKVKNDKTNSRPKYDLSSLIDASSTNINIEEKNYENDHQKMVDQKQDRSFNKSTIEMNIKIGNRFDQLKDNVCTIDDENDVLVQNDVLVPNDILVQNDVLVPNDILVQNDVLVPNDILVQNDVLVPNDTLVPNEVLLKNDALVLNVTNEHMEMNSLEKSLEILATNNLDEREGMNSERPNILKDTLTENEKVSDTDSLNHDTSSSNTICQPISTATSEVKPWRSTRQRQQLLGVQQESENLFDMKYKRYTDYEQRDAVGSNNILDLIIKKKLETEKKDYTGGADELIVNKSTPKVDNSRNSYRSYMIEKEKKEKQEMMFQQDLEQNSLALQYDCFKFLINDSSKYEYYEELFSKLYNTEPLSTNLKHQVQKLFTTEELNKCIPFFFVAKLLVVKTINQLIINPSTDNQSDINLLNQTRKIINDIKSLINAIWDSNDIPNSSYIFLDILQRILSTLKYPIISQGLSLIEALWDSLFLENVIDKKTFTIWLENSYSSAPGKSTAIFQTNAWFNWINAEEENYDDEIISSDEDEFQPINHNTHNDINYY